VGLRVIVFRGGGVVLLTRKMDVCTTLYNAISASLVILNIYGPNGCMPLSYGHCLDWMNDIVDTITLATEPRGRQFPFSLP